MTTADDPSSPPDDLDAHLGPARSRFFGSGYRRVRYSLADLHAAGPAGRAAGWARVTYPSDWSAKKGVARTAHLGTGDALVLTYVMAEAALRTLGLDDDQVARAWFERIAVRAGTRPVTDLDRVAVTVSTAASTPSDGAGPALSDGVRTDVECRVGSLVATAVLRHETPSGGPRTWQEAHDLLARGSVGGELFARTGHRTRIVDLDVAGGSIRSEHLLDPAPERPGGGIEAAYWPSATVMDALVLTGQLGQVLIYAAAGVDRDSADTLWMRRMTFELDSPWRPTAGTHESQVTIGRHRTFVHDGRTLHDVEAHCPGIAGVRATAWLAYYDDAVPS
ncbi:MAG: hypothetical protein KJ792_01855 [Actinobacteria bacterium]|nr:hypothetical protein [Actinomycetota bacterium]MCG2800721.1 hypothetical protein [Cellulomonas sp.]